ncbi:MAG: PIN domain-containing protein [Allorhizobium sp.]
MTAVERVYLDTNVFIMLSEKDHRLQQLLVRMISSQPSEKPPKFATSELTLSELLVKPYQVGDDTLINGYESLILNSEWLDVRPVDRAVLYYAAALRAQYRHLKLPDAIVLATADREGCILVTRNAKDFDPNDPRIRLPYRS